jgi:U3 small nucleolar RNA-associated protein 14
MGKYIFTFQTKREVLYENAKKDVSRWNAIVYHNRLADQMVFPLNAGKKVPRKTGKDAAQDFVVRTRLAF